jgi:hypothetical protein
VQVNGGILVRKVSVSLEIRKGLKLRCGYKSSSMIVQQNAGSFVEQRKSDIERDKWEWVLAHGGDLVIEVC